MDDLLPKLVAMTHNAAHNYLMGLDLPHELRVSLAEKVDSYRKHKGKAQKQSKLVQVYHAELWYRLLAPLKYELSNAKVGLKLKSFDVEPERHHAFSEYIALMEKLLAGLQKLQIDEGRKASVSIFERSKADTKAHTEYAKTPAEIAMQRGLPEKGAHWTHWINERTKQRIHALFDSIPNTKAKRPVPFAYRVPPALFRRDREALQKRTLKELDMAMQELSILRDIVSHQRDVATSDQLEDEAKLVDTVRRMSFALRHMTFNMNNEPLPATWHALGQLYRGAQDDGLDDTPDGVDVDLIRILRRTLKLSEPEPENPKKKTNRPKRYKV